MKKYLEKENLYQLKNFLLSKGICFDICSGYLSLENQKNKYNDFLNRNGLEMTKNRMALPLFIEHHTGLAIDCDYYVNGDWAGICNEENPETKFIHSILHHFGFILRYPSDKTDITKMQYEPWHIRYVGVALARHLYEENKTL